MIGVDEVGRGCLAGPLLVVAARQITTLPRGTQDSKLLSQIQRENLFKRLVNTCVFGKGWVTASEIDSYGLAEGMRIGVNKALLSLEVTSDEEIIMDGRVNYASDTFKNVSCLISADKLIPIVSAASIYAKVVRDKFMRDLHSQYPRYGFKNHVGYGTARHMEALRLYGPLKKIHRYSIKTVHIKSGSDI